MYVAKTYIRSQRTLEPAMGAFTDATRDLDERNTERMNFRTKPHIKHAIRRAAALSGVDDSVFAMNAAYKSALETIAQHERTLLDPIDHDAFFAALDNPPAATAKLKQAFDRHRKTVISR